MHDLDGQTKLVGVIGWPVEHSLSPAMHNAALRRMGLNWCYVPLSVPPGSVADAIQGVVALGFRGVNVTVPHKQAAMQLMDHVAPEAAAVGAVNTLVIDRDGGGTATLKGHNTDVAGFLGSLRGGGFEPSDGGKAVVIGAGGAARAVVYGLVTTGLSEVVVLNRTWSRAEALVSELGSHVSDSSLRAMMLNRDALLGETAEADLLVNATTLGMWPEVGGAVWPEDTPVPAALTVYDLVYNPLETRLLHRARQSGARAIDGLGMLARQGAIALGLWLGSEGDVDAVTAEMRGACLAALAHRLPSSRAHSG